MNQLDSLTLYEGGQIHLSLRIAEHEGAFWYDMTDKEGTAIKVVPGKWERIYRPPLLFKQYGVELPQVDPDPKGQILPLFNLLKISDKQQQLLIAVWLVYSLIPNVPETDPLCHR